jgi:excisionase family DNA binding protein
MDVDIQYFNSIEASKLLGVNVSTIKRWTEEGKLKCIKTAGGHRKFEVKHFQEFLNKYHKQIDKASIFPIENEADIKISKYILRADFSFLHNLVVKRALMFDRKKIQKILNGLYLSQIPLHVVYDRLISPVLHTIGSKWEQNEITVAQEHFAAQVIRDCLIRLQGILSLPSSKKGNVICLTLSNELHDLALKMVDHLLELRGFKVFYSGAQTPAIELGAVFKKINPKRVYLSSTFVENLDDTQREFDTLCELCNKYKSKLFIGGQGFDFIKFDRSIIERRLYTFEETYLF